MLSREIVCAIVMIRDCPERNTARGYSKVRKKYDRTYETTEERIGV